MLLVGVNGTGKTTTIGKLAYRLHEAGASVVIGAADTFRAAAAEQLETWASRASADFVGSTGGADPAAVAFDAVSAGEARGRDVVIIDTAGRLHTQEHLMEELSKVRRVVAQRLPGAPHETLLTIDATTGQNGLQQARRFAAATDVTGIVLTKLDGSAKGGIAIAIAHELGIPIKLIGIGESLEDLRPFDPQEFARALLASSRRREPDEDGECEGSRQGAERVRDGRPSPLPRRGADREDDAERPRDEGRREEIGDPERLHCDEQYGGERDRDRHRSSQQQVHVRYDSSVSKRTRHPSSHPPTGFGRVATGSELAGSLQPSAFRGRSVTSAFIPQRSRLIEAVKRS